MKLQEKTSRIYKNKEYKKSWVVIPSKLLKELNWIGGCELKAQIKGKKLIINSV